MNPKQKEDSAMNPKKEDFRVEGSLQLETLKRVPKDLELTAYAFDRAGHLIGSGPVDEEGKYSVAVKIKDPQDFKFLIAPKAEPETVRESAVYHKSYSADDWIEKNRAYRIFPDLFVPEEIWRPWWPWRICVSGHVRKLQTNDGTATYCPVPYVKVEIFDVDREGCWWPYIVRARDLFDRRVIRVPELVKEIPDIPPRPWPPEPDPIGPIARLRRPGGRPSARSSVISTPESIAAFTPVPEPPATRDPGIAGVNPQPEPGSAEMGLFKSLARLGPQPEPPDLPVFRAWVGSQGQRVGEIRSVEESLASRLDGLTLSSRVAPWVLWRHCFYSKEEICETYTDCNGYFRCCFSWWPWHFRRGRLRFDLRPDIIIRVTQVIDGVERIIYLDPYTSTRWNVTNTHIDLFLDDEDIICGAGCGPDPDLADSQATLLQIGRDEVWKINQANGEYQIPGTSNGAYGGSLLVRGDFSASLKDGTSTRYYRLSYAKATATGDVPADEAFVPIVRPLEVLRALPFGAFHTHIVGPKTVGTESGLYEVQDTAHWWITPWDSIPYLTVGGGMVLGVWPTRSFESGEGTYYLRMEMFDDTGTKMAGVAFVDHGGDGSGDDPDPPPVSVGRLDIKVKIDNEPMAYDVLTPAPDECGIIPWSAGLTLDFTVQASQANGRVHTWSLHYVKGTVSTEHYLGSDTYSNGTANVNESVSGAPMLVDLSTSCAFALILRAWSHVRVNHGWRRYENKEYAVAIERCPPCPP